MDEIRAVLSGGMQQVRDLLAATLKRI